MRLWTVLRQTGLWCFCLLVGVSAAESVAKADVPLRGFGQIGYTAQDTDDNSAKSNGNNFYNGGLDLFLSTAISKKVNFLSEVVFEMNSSNETVTDIERVVVQYVYSPWLKIGAGRFHTALGYWNDNFHHGSWLHASIERPLAYRFEDDGGVLPTHAEGLEIRGEGDLGPGQLGYIVNIANGRGPKVDPPQVVGDADKSKAANVLLYYNLGHLRFGGVYYADTLPGCVYDSTTYAGNLSGIDNCAYTGPNAIAQRARGTEKIFGGHLVYNSDEIEFLMEYFVVAHEYSSTTGEVAAKVNTGYVQVGYLLGDWTPYYRYDTLEVPEDKTDAYTLLEGKTTAHTAGVRYELDETSAVKFEYHNKALVHASAALGTTKLTSVTANWSFTF